MDEYSENRKYLYRNSYKYYYEINFALHVREVICIGSSLTDFASVPLVTLSLGSIISPCINKVLYIKEMRLNSKSVINMKRFIIQL